MFSLHYLCCKPIFVIYKYLLFLSIGTIVFRFSFFVVLSTEIPYVGLYLSEIHLADEATVSTGFFFLTLMTFDRWMSIEFPFSYLSKMNKRVRKRLIVASWICGGFAASISVVAKKNPMVCPFEESEPTLFIIPTLALSLSSTVFWYGRIATIALQTKPSRRKQTKFRLAKTMSNFIILLSWNWELSKKYAILFQYSLFNSFCQLFHLNNNKK